MEEFLNRKRKQEESRQSEKSCQPENNCQPVNKPNNCDKKPVTNNQPVPPKQKKTTRNFNDEWENLYFVTEQNGKPVCLICQEEIAANKKYNVQKHFGKHSAHDVNFPVSSTKRAAEIKRLKSELDSQQKATKKFFSENEIGTHASYEISYQIAKHAKSYSDGEFHKKLLCSTIEILCENYENKFKSQLLDKVKALPLSHQTIGRRVNEIGADIEDKLKHDLAHCEAFSLALDETTDISSGSQLLFWVRYVIGDRIEENILALVPLTERTRGEDILKAFIAVESRFNLDLTKLVSVCTDGAPAMIGIHSGFVAKLKEYIAEKYANLAGDLISYHCIIHQENLCAKAMEKNCKVLDTVTKVSISNLVLILTE